jgi:predicted O-methyltransferase YrrM
MQTLIVALLCIALALLVKIYLELRNTRETLADTRRALTQNDRRMDELPAQVQSDLQRESEVLFARLEAYTSLRDRLGLRQGLPYTRHWSAAPDFLQAIVEHALEARPSTILECSSGLTTLMLARCCQLNGRGRVISLENGEEFAVKTRSTLERYDLQDYAEVRHAPLEPLTLGGQEFSWYGRDRLPPGPIDMLVIDGPPGYLHPLARYPALPLLHERLADGCVLFLDDAARPDEGEIVRQWLSAYPDSRHDYLETERGCSVLVLRRSQGKPPPAS